jgi:hypothetical protein
MKNSNYRMSKGGWEEKTESFLILLRQEKQI